LRVQVSDFAPQVFCAKRIREFRIAVMDEVPASLKLLL